MLRKCAKTVLRVFCKYIPLPWLAFGCLGLFVYMLLGHQRAGNSKTTTTDPKSFESLKTVIEAFMTASPGTQGSGRVRHHNENMARQHLETLLGQPFPKVRPEWLTNPLTGRRLELDMYCDELTLAVEYDGAQHAFYVPHFHGSPEAFRQQQQRDSVKEITCAQRNVHLLRIPYNIPADHLGSYLEGALNTIPRFRELIAERRRSGLI